MASVVHADEKPALTPGNYIVYYAFSSTAPEQAFGLIKVEKKGGKLTGELLDKPAGLPADFESFTVDGRLVEVVFDLGGRKLSFEGFVDAKNPKLANGSFGDDKLLSRGKIVSTEHEKLEKEDLVVKIEAPADYAKAAKLASAVAQLKAQAQRAKSAESKEKLKEKLAEVEKDQAEQAPAIYKAILEKNADSPVVVDAVLGLMRMGEKAGKPADAVAWLKAAETFAEPLGTRFYADVLMKSGEAMKEQKGFETTAINTLEKTLKLLGAKATTAQQVRVLKAIHTAQEKAGKADAAKQTEARLAKLEDQLDKDYLAKVPPFKPRAFEGRKGKSERVAVFELFTGAQCPPCVASDVAFDALLKSYPATELVLLQYHMHIPGPDPLTNPSTIARWDYYKEKFPQAMRGTPSTVFNGKPSNGGGGGMGQAKAMFDNYTATINPLLEEETTIKITGSAALKGEKISIKVDVDGVPEPGENVKLRVILVEDTVKHVGGNGLRFHHQIVRSFPGGIEGTAFTDKKLAKTVDVDLAEVRKGLKKYLDEYDEDDPFENLEKLLDLKKLRIVVLVQDDTSRAILQAFQMDVK